MFVVNRIFRLLSISLVLWYFPFLVKLEIIICRTFNFTRWITFNVSCSTPSFLLRFVAFIEIRHVMAKKKQTNLNIEVSSNATTVHNNKGLFTGFYISFA